jgi:hypothetical protein
MINVRTTKSISIEQGCIRSICLVSPANTPSLTIDELEDAISVWVSQRMSCEDKNFWDSKELGETYLAPDSLHYLPSIFNSVVAHKISHAVMTGKHFTLNIVPPQPVKDATYGLNLWRLYR